MSQSLKLVIPVEWGGDEDLIEVEDEIKQYVLENINDFLLDAWVERRLNSE